MAFKALLIQARLDNQQEKVRNRTLRRASLRANHFNQVLIILVALHSFLLGTAMLLAPSATMRFFGWEYQGPMFYPAQTGVFLILMGVAYTAGLWHLDFAWFLVLSKTVAMVFLLIEYYFVEVDPPRTLLMAAWFDGAMGALVFCQLIKSK